MAENNNFKAPQVLIKGIPTWKKELAIWQTFTSIDKKQAPAIFLTLLGQAREAVTELH